MVVYQLSGKKPPINQNQWHVFKCRSLKRNVKKKSLRKSTIYPASFPSETELTLLGSQCLGL